MKLNVLFYIVCLWGSCVGLLNDVKAQEIVADENVVAKGILPIFKFGDKIYLLVAENLLNREFMITAQVDRGRGKHGELLESKGMFLLCPGKDKELCVYDVSMTEQVTNNGFCSSKLKGLNSPKETWPVDKCVREGYLVDITGWLKEPGEWYSLDNNLRMLNYAVPDVLEAVACENGVSFRVRHCVYTNYKQGVVEMVAENGSSYVDISVSLKLLPEDYGKAVIMFPDSPFRTQLAVDYGISPFGCTQCSRGIHWDFSKEKPLKISVGVDMPEVYQRALQKAIAYVSQKTGIAGAIILEQKSRPLDVTDPCGVVFAGCDKELEVKCMEHPATGVLLFGRMAVGEKDMAARILRWQLKNIVQDDREQWSVCSNDYAYERCLEENMVKGLLMLLGIDKAKLEDKIKHESFWNALRYVYANDSLVLKKGNDDSFDDDLWKQFIQLRYSRKRLLEQMEFERVLDYYKQCLVLAEEEYVSVFKSGGWKRGDVSRLLVLMNEDASDFYATDYIRRNMLGREAREIRESLERIWCEFFNLDRWLEWAQRHDGDEIFSVLERELTDWLYGKKMKKKSLSSAEMLVRKAFGNALGKQLKSCQESINYGSGVAENRVLSCWESFYLSIP